jgi:hypothetical protein
MRSTVTGTTPSNQHQINRLFDYAYLPPSLPIIAKHACKGKSTVELPSEIESYRQVLTFRTPEGQAATVIVMRRRSAVWVTFNGAMKTTVVMQGEDAGQLIDAVSCAAGSPR